MNEPMPACPRCGGALDGEGLYGPCPACREELTATMRAEVREVDVGLYEPKMNVTPNQVATKE